MFETIILLAILAGVGYLIYRDWDKIEPILEADFNTVKADIEKVIPKADPKTSTITNV